MRLIILAAGDGDRMGTNYHKGLIKYEGETIIGRLMRQVCLPSYIVVGAYADQVMREFYDEATFVYNPFYKESGPMMSLKIAYEALGIEDAVIAYGDTVFFENKAVSTIVENNHHAAVVSNEYATGVSLRIKDDKTIDTIHAGYNPTHVFGGMCRMTHDDLGAACQLSSPHHTLGMYVGGFVAIETDCVNLNSVCDVSRMLAWMP